MYFEYLLLIICCRFLMNMNDTDNIDILVISIETFCKQANLISLETIMKFKIRFEVRFFVYDFCLSNKVSQ